MTQQTLGRYRILERIGKGAMGLVYKGEDPKLDRIVALKVILPPSEDHDAPENRYAIDRLYAEARAAARVTHPAIVTVYDVGEDETEAGPVVYIAMEFLDGENLDQWRTRRPHSPVESLSVIRRLAEGLAVAHHRGVIHRDVKPSNIVMTPEGPKLTDFGLAHLPSEGTPTLTGKVIGTPAYMSPEQVEGKNSGPQSDIFSLSVVLYQLLTGGLPFAGGSVMGTMYNIVNSAPPLPSNLAQGLPPSTDTVLMKGLAKELTLRFKTAADLIAGIDLLLAEAEGTEKETVASDQTDTRSLDDTPPPFPTITYSVDDDQLARRLGPLFKRRGMPCHKSPALPERELAKHLLFHLRKGHVALLHFAHKTYYQPTLTTFTVADLLRIVRQLDPSAPTERIVPLFITVASSRKQQEVLRLLGAYGITYALFLSPDDSPATQEDLITNALLDFVELMENDFVIVHQAPELFDDEAVAPTRQYEELLALGTDLMRRGKFEEAIAALTHALELKPDFDILIQRGDAFYKTRKYVAALADYRKAQKLKNSTPEPDAKIGACCLILAKELKTEDPDKAAEWFERGLERLERSQEIARGLEETYADEPERLGGSPYAPILSALRGVDVAENDFGDRQRRLSTVIETAVARSGDSAKDDLEALLDRGAGFIALGRYDDAEDILRPVFARHPTEGARVYNNFAVALRKNGHLERAFETFARLVAAPVPDHERILKNMRTATMHFAHALIVEGKGEKAEAIYHQALALKMDDPEWIFCDLALAHLHAGGGPAARVYLDKAVALAPGLVSSKRFAEYRSLAPLLATDKRDLSL